MQSRCSRGRAESVARGALRRRLPTAGRPLGSEFLARVRIHAMPCSERSDRAVGVAAKHAAVWPRHASFGPIGEPGTRSRCRHLGTRQAFAPPPSVDAAVLQLERRTGGHMYRLRRTRCTGVSSPAPSLTLANPPALSGQPSPACIQTASTATASRQYARGGSSTPAMEASQHSLEAGSFVANRSRAKTSSGGSASDRIATFKSCPHLGGLDAACPPWAPSLQAWYPERGNLLAGRLPLP